jgi:hypothetical protein
MVDEDKFMLGSHLSLMETIMTTVRKEWRFTSRL